MFRFFCIYSLLLGILSYSCNSGTTYNHLEQYKADSTLIWQYNKKAKDTMSINNYNPIACAKAILYFDSAVQIAQINKHPYLLAYSYQGLGLGYEAWNQDVANTISNFKKALKYYNLYNKATYERLYCKYLLAHTYSKQRNKYNTNIILDELYNEIVLLPDSIKKQLDFTILMARSYAMETNYDKMELCLNNLTKREWIKNNETSYYFLDLYYTFKATIDVRKNKVKQTPYLDSMVLQIQKCKSLNQVSELSQSLAEIYNELGEFNKSKNVEKIKLNAINAIGTTDDDDLIAAKIINQLIQTQANNDAVVKNIELRNTKIITSIVALLAITVALLAFYLIRRNKIISIQKQQLATNIIDLENRNIEIETLNKEMYHRVKNNLQMMQSLLHIQEKKTENEALSEVLKELRLRINSITNLHAQTLAHDKEINFSLYIKELINNALSINKTEKKIVTHIEVDTIDLQQKNMYSLGLIVNEWITNTAKYATAKDNIIHCYLNISNVNNTIVVNYHNTGNTIASVYKKGMGLYLIELLAKQLNGALTINNNFNYKLIIPNHEY